MVDEEILFLLDIKTYSKELFEYVSHLSINDEILKEILVYLEASTSEIDNIFHYILELQSKISILEQNL